MEIELIGAKETDQGFLFDLRKQTMVKHLEKAGIYLSDQEHMARVNKHFEASKIIIKSGKRIGLLKCLETLTNIEIMQLQIAPQFQGMGIGKYLVNELISKATLESKNISLNVLKENPAKHLYLRCGFTIISEDEYEFHMKRNISETSK